MIKEFKEFAVKGNMIDMAVGIIIGGAFGTIVKSLVEDVIMPPLGYLMAGIDFSKLYVSLDGKDYASFAKAKEASAPVIGYGLFANHMISFLIVAMAVFMLVKVINKLKRAEEAPAAPPAPKEEVLLLTQIRDSLAKK
ncbi:MAG: large conductance mechanosensitive channel protein MscL [Planctomycetes bacterium]|nr:large conductance mechanosensitive channel protein MscL [Planctomycetota bacterium]MCB9872485.1 large conductance mechanosensitive channel protein MscL [Planctomycetota bacterium]